MLLAALSAPQPCEPAGSACGTAGVGVGVGGAVQRLAELLAEQPCAAPVLHVLQRMLHASCQAGMMQAHLHSLAQAGQAQRVLPLLELLTQLLVLQPHAALLLVLQPHGASAASDHGGGGIAASGLADEEGSVLSATSSILVQHAQAAAQQLQAILTAQPQRTLPAHTTAGQAAGHLQRNEAVTGVAPQAGGGALHVHVVGAALRLMARLLCAVGLLSAEEPWPLQALLQALAMQVARAAPRLMAPLTAPTTTSGASETEPPAPAPARTVAEVAQVAAGMHALACGRASSDGVVAAGMVAELLQLSSMLLVGVSQAARATNIG